MSRLLSAEPQKWKCSSCEVDQVRGCARGMDCDGPSRTRRLWPHVKNRSQKWKYVRECIIFSIWKRKNTRGQIYTDSRIHTRTRTQKKHTQTHRHVQPSTLSRRVYAPTHARGSLSSHPAELASPEGPHARASWRSARSVCRNRPTNEGNLSTPRSAADETIHLLGVRHRLVAPSRPCGITI